MPPLNLVGDFGGGGMFLAYGVVCGLLEAQRSGAGQVIDAAMVDGAATLMTMFWSMLQMGMMDEANRGTNLLDTGAHFYNVYRCADGEYVSIGSIEPQFYAELMRLTGLEGDEEFAGQMDRSRWPALKARLSEVFASKTRDEWCALMEHTDVCFAPVLRLSETAEHPHNVARSVIVDVDGVKQPAPAPRFSRTVPDAGPATCPCGPAHARDPRGLGRRQGPHRRPRRVRSRGRRLADDRPTLANCRRIVRCEAILRTERTISRLTSERTYVC